MPVNYGSLSFQEQIDFFANKLNLGTRGWTDIWQSGHDYAFTVAGAMRDDLLNDLRSSVDDAIRNGTTLETFRKRFDQIVSKHGWQFKGGRNWRTQLIYNTNLRTSYQAGRYQQMQRLKSRLPFWQYQHNDNVARPRPQHLAWDNLVLKADDSWWDTHYPPNGWGCRCRVRPLNQKDMDKLGKSNPDQAPPLNLQEIEVGTRSNFPRTVNVPLGIDPGWGYAPGRRVRLNKLISQRLQQGLDLPAAQGSVSLTQTLHQPGVLPALMEDYKAWTESVIQSKRAGNQYKAVGVISPDVLKRLEQKGITPESAVIIIRDAEILHILRDAKISAKTKTGLSKVIDQEDLLKLPGILSNPKAIYWDTYRDGLIYIFNPKVREAGKIVVRIDFTMKLSKEGKQVVNSIRTAGLIDSFVMELKRWEKIWP